MRNPSTIDIVVEILKEMGIPEELIMSYSFGFTGSIHIKTACEIREIRKEWFPEPSSPKKETTSISKYSLQMQIEDGKTVKIFGKRGSGLSVHDPDFVEHFKDGIREALRDKIDLKGLQKAKKLLDEYLEIFAPIIEGS